jgi:hypothetical protein
VFSPRFPAALDNHKRTPFSRSTEIGLTVTIAE